MSNTQPLRALSTVLLIIAAGLNLAFLIGILASRGEVSPLVNVFISTLAQWVPAAVFWVVAVRTRFQRADVLFAASGITFNALADTFYATNMGDDGNLPFPSIADVGYLLFYPLLLVALILFARRQSSGFDKSTALDAAVASLGAAALVAVLLRPIIDDAFTGTNVLEAVVGAAYPLFDLVLIATIAGIAASPTLRVGSRWKTLVAGLLIFACADIAYALLELNEAYVAGTPLDIAWTLGVLFTAWWVDGLDRDLPSDDHLGTKLPVTAFGVVAGLSVLVFGSLQSISVLALVLATSSVALAAVPVVYRQLTLAKLLADQRAVVVQLEHLDRAKSEMLATVNHELRTPLTAIRGYLELVLDGDGGELPGEAKEMLEIVDHNASRLQVLVNDMLTMSRLDSGATSANITEVPIDRVLQLVVQNVGAFARSRKVHLLLDTDAPGAVVMGDANQLERAFTNLIDNAVKFTPEDGMVTVTLDFDPTIKRGVLVTVKDTGIGIPADELPLLFERFYRATNAQTGALPGTGLGLSIVQSLIESHGGAIAVESAVDVGTTFRVQLPVQADAAAAR